MEALFSGISAVAEGFLQLVWLLFASLGRLGLATDSQLPPTQRHRHLVAGLLGIGVVVVVIAIIVGVVLYCDSDRGRAQGVEFRITSAGPDGVLGTDDDVTADRHELRAKDVVKAVGAELVEAAKNRWRQQRDNEH